MASSRLVRIIGSALLVRASIAGSSGSTAPSPTFPAQGNISTAVYNVSAATATISYNYTNEELAMLWNQVGSIAVGPITTTVTPTPEPSSYPRPGVFHAQVHHVDFYILCSASNFQTGSYL